MICLIVMLLAHHWPQTPFEGFSYLFDLLTSEECPASLIENSRLKVGVNRDE